jgi:hypothetical protein
LFAREARAQAMAAEIAADRRSEKSVEAPSSL